MSYFFGSALVFRPIQETSAWERWHARFPHRFSAHPGSDGAGLHQQHDDGDNAEFQEDMTYPAPGGPPPRRRFEWKGHSSQESRLVHPDGQSRPPARQRIFNLVGFRENFGGEEISCKSAIPRKNYGQREQHEGKSIISPCSPGAASKSEFTRASAARRPGTRLELAALGASPFVFSVLPSNFMIFTWSAR